ncbi:hypothetical protein MBM_06562 [Drepanopeziza brunnea f. sp. 'multigermtubi' MB_m1]|uniref:Uncharacterized protein n=1 Tax=Marssonina brunnea f. sp. multigermtubi (strain MB_m1) TaxID=1072389 RepID=K1WQP8_MARBU|nr:uncharacterized protein MBM_06562 [Drepanopeziza brunnea f. sp. 'multigermtubi' MB_m1]EKD15346.1 hypothetical protein MBM_06562 [Drepanopeziza brunnea f. sp. 'multigermtubi' MB_m1]
MPNIRIWLTTSISDNIVQPESSSEARNVVIIRPLSCGIFVHSYQNRSAIYLFLCASFGGPPTRPPARLKTSSVIDISPKLTSSISRRRRHRFSTFAGSKQAGARSSSPRRSASYPPTNYNPFMFLQAHASHLPEFELEIISASELEPSPPQEPAASIKSLLLTDTIAAMLCLLTRSIRIL